VAAVGAGWLGEQQGETGLRQCGAVRLRGERVEGDMKNPSDSYGDGGGGAASTISRTTDAFQTMPRSDLS